MVFKNINLKNVVTKYRLGFEKMNLNFCLDNNHKLSHHIYHTLQNVHIDFFYRTMNTIYISFFLSLKKTLDGYQFPVFQTESCPRNETEWTGRSSVLNCTKSNGYMCMPSEKFTILLEFCYSQDKLVIQNGKKKNEVVKCFIIYGHI